MAVAQEFENFAHQLIDEAAALTTRFFRTSLAVHQKDHDCSLVTWVDLQVEKTLREMILNRFPYHTVIGEEEGISQRDNAYTWVIDPIDGTISYTFGKPFYTTLVALLEEDSPVLSIIDQPILRERWVGQKGAPTRWNNQPVRCRATEALQEARLNCTTPAMFTTAAAQEKFAQLQRHVKGVSFGGDAYGFGLLASGHIDLIVEADLKYHDVAAVIPIVEGAGGVITDWQGKALTSRFDGTCLAAGTQALHHQALRILYAK